MAAIDDNTDIITELILKAKDRARKSIEAQPDPPLSERLVNWPVECTIGPGLEGAIACETEVGYVNGSKGSLIYSGYDVFDLCAYSSFEEVSFLLLHGRLPVPAELEAFKKKLIEYRHIPNTLRMMMGTPVEDMSPMSSIRLGVNFLRRRLSWRDHDEARPSPETAIASDDDSIAMETKPFGEKRAIFEFKNRKQRAPKSDWKGDDGRSLNTCMHLVSALSVIAAAVARLRDDKLPIESDPELSHAGNFLYMMTGKKPTALETRIMDVSLILHADHGMNASTFASMVVASTMSDIYFSIGAGISALTGPLHGGANEQVMNVLKEIGSPEKVDAWYGKARKDKRMVPGFGHRVYKTYDPRALILGPLAKYLSRNHPEFRPLYLTARELEKNVVSTLGKEKNIFPNVDFYSGLTYGCMGIPTDMFTPIFAVSRVSGWTARVHEYLKKNRIFRPRGMYVGKLDKKFVSIESRRRPKKK